jgi:hypothetical protein
MDSGGSDGSGRGGHRGGGWWWWWVVVVGWAVTLLVVALGDRCFYMNEHVHCKVPGVGG